MDEESKDVVDEQKPEGRAPEAPGSGDMGEELKKELPAIPSTVVRVLTDPKGFYREMPKAGGFFPPLVFMVILGIAAGIIQAVLGIVGLTSAGSVGMAILAVILMPIFVVIFGFIGGAVIFIVWKIMGSDEPYETAFRCMAYAGAITPVTAVLSVIPYLGGIAGFVWITFLMVVASTEVHRIGAKKAWVVFGAICVFFSLITLSMEYGARKVQGSMEGWQKGMNKELGDIEDMTPAEAGKALGDLMKGLKEAQEKE